MSTAQRRRLLRWRNAIRTWTTAGVDLLFPPTCVACGRPGWRICPRCAQLVLPMPPTLCQRCGRTQPTVVERCDFCTDDAAFPLQRARAAALHVSPLREWIHLLKYEGRRDLAPLLARYLVAALDRPDWSEILLRLNAVAPVPLHDERRRERGYNQAELLAQALCERRRLPLRTDLLQRSKLTRSQVGLNRAERQENVQDAFTAVSTCRGLSVLLIDDVYTTGATLCACASALLKMGAAAVYALTLAIPERPDASDLPDDAFSDHRVGRILADRTTTSTSAS
ncbi:MAG: ComF family protein [Caldilinea sp.]|nr:ComF family protein [Caldilinea sp.]MDW8441909.1 ComF family protein [Caldilineaceae bacterium]